MFEILTQWILELERLLIYFLRPLSLVFSSEDPPLHVLCFKYENAEARYKYMVDLRRAVWRRQDYVVHSLVCFFVQHEPGKKPDEQFADIALTPRRFQYPYYYCYRDEPPEGFQNYINDREEIHGLSCHLTVGVAGALRFFRAPGSPRYYVLQ